MIETHRVWIAVGSNVGNRQATIQQAIQEIQALPSTEVMCASAWHETEPVGLPPGAAAFLNGVLEIQTTLNPSDLMRQLLRIEAELGRVRHATGYQSRTLDLDILLFEDKIISEPHLHIPHPRMLEREFVLHPLSELCPFTVIPGRNITVLDALNQINRIRNRDKQPV